METLNFNVGPSIAKIILSGDTIVLSYKEDIIDAKKFLAEWENTVDYFRMVPDSKKFAVCDASGNRMECVTIQGVHL